MPGNVIAIGAVVLALLECTGWAVLDGYLSALNLPVRLTAVAPIELPRLGLPVVLGDVTILMAVVAIFGLWYAAAMGRSSRSRVENITVDLDRNNATWHYFLGRSMLHGEFRAGRKVFVPLGQGALVALIFVAAVNGGSQHGIRLADGVLRGTSSFSTANARLQSAVTVVYRRGAMSNSTDTVRGTIVWQDGTVLYVAPVVPDGLRALAGRQGVLWTAVPVNAIVSMTQRSVVPASVRGSGAVAPVEVPLWQNFAIVGAVVFFLAVLVRVSVVEAPRTGAFRELKATDLKALRLPLVDARRIQQALERGKLVSLCLTQHGVERQYAIPKGVFDEGFILEKGLKTRVFGELNRRAG